MMKRAREQGTEPVTGGSRVRWAPYPMTEDEKNWVRKVMSRGVQRYGVVRQETVPMLTRNGTMTDKFCRTGAAVPDVVWSWIAERQAAGGPDVDAGLRRRVGSGSKRVMPRWEWYSRVRSGWARPVGMTRKEVVLMQEADEVLALLWMEQEGLEWDMGVKGEVLVLRNDTVTRVWRKVRRRLFVGEGGYAQLTRTMAVLLLQGDVEGGVGLSPRGTWWAQGREAMAKMGMAVQEDSVEDRSIGSLMEDEHSGQRKVQVVVDWMAGTQSLRSAVPRGVLYIPFDWQEWVYSLERNWSQNIVVDLSQVGGQQMWDLVQAEVRVRCGRGAEVGSLLLAMSPCCRTFSRADSSNTTRGHNYRLFGLDHPTRPPKDLTSKKGKEAQAADRMVRKAISVARYFVNKLGAWFYIENPAGGLCRRPYMRGLVLDKFRRVLVHYCAYRHFYHKPTHIWTNLDEGRWRPQGTTGTGLCCSRCTEGEWSSKGRWTHRYTIAQGSKQAKGGAGRRANKQMMPRLLHLEILKAAGMA